jgi:hypothetical protein
VREIVSAENSEVKFIAGDHPVTVYNHAALPDALMCQYPNDPQGIANKFSADAGFLPSSDEPRICPRAGNEPTRKADFRSEF